MAKQTVVIGFLGTTLDTGGGPTRWEKWRPTISLCQHEDLLIHRFELLHRERDREFAERIKADIECVSPETTVCLQERPAAAPWDFAQVYEDLYDFSRQYRWNTEEEDYLIHISTGTHVAQICLFLMTESRHLPGRLIQSSPPRAPEQGCGTYVIIDLDLSQYDRIAQRFQVEATEAASFLKSGIETRNARFNSLIERIERVAIQSRDPLLLMGPTGAGKSQLARRIFELKQARHQVKGRFTDVNCATLRGDGAMSTLFGHVKGSYTGATRDRAGLLREADQGVLFLDEIGELGLDEQAMLLRALEEKTFLPLGADRAVRSDFQLIAGTNRDLLQCVHAGRFREDLLARINLWTFRLPGLRERKEDIEPNLRYELDQYARRTGTRVAFNKEARTAFLRFATSEEARWTGNFRDLSAAVVRMATLAEGGRITEPIVEEEIDRLRCCWQPPPEESLAEEYLSAEQIAAIDLFDRAQLEQVLKVCRESRSMSEAGRRLFAASRAQKQSSNDADRLRKYLQRFGLTWSLLR